MVLQWFTICVLVADLLLLALWWCFGLDCYFVWDGGGVWVFNCCVLAAFGCGWWVWCCVGVLLFC